ncbi:MULTISPECIES: hypothetical protein [unclassified Bradyrhizobium]|uniref:AbiU2 domain-containing protein n=1 Tax=unclassified Bradyrhizobium TaxID=2631580 RepID=UPI0028E2F025|nr:MULTISPECIES: hypothetical protein [unclassified Bradyrhizobium]
MRTEQQVQAAAAAAAEKANGGKFTDPLFYKPEHQAFWREVVRAALDAADAARPTKPSTPVSKEEIQTFSEHCVYIRSVWVLMMRIWRDSTQDERNLMESIAPTFFADVGQTLTEMMIIAACRITDRATSGGNENFTVELFANSFVSDAETYKQLDGLHQRMKKLREQILPARHKLGAHADRDVIRKGQVLGHASFEDWEEFWLALQDFVRIVNEKTTGKPFEIDAGGVFGDAEMMLKALQQSTHFEKLLNGSDAAVADACLNLVLPKG